MSNTFFQECEKFCGKLAVVTGSAESAQLWPPKMLTEAPLMVIYKKVFDVMLHLGAEWPSKQNTLIADTILTESGP